MPRVEEAIAATILLSILSNMTWTIPPLADVTRNAASAPDQRSVSR